MHCYILDIAAVGPMVLKNFYSIILHHKSMEANDPKGHSQFEPQGHCWHDLCKEPDNKFSHYRSMAWTPGA